MLGPASGLWSVAVPGTLDLELRHLAFHDPGVGSEPATREDLEEQLGQGLGQGVSQGLRGKNPGATPWYGVPPGECG